MAEAAGWNVAIALDWWKTRRTYLEDLWRVFTMGTRTWRYPIQPIVENPRVCSERSNSNFHSRYRMQEQETVPGFNEKAKSKKEQNYSLERERSNVAPQCLATIMQWRSNPPSVLHFDTNINKHSHSIWIHTWTCAAIEESDDARSVERLNTKGERNLLLLLAKWKLCIFSFEQ